jgi:hypothetical protein
MVDRKKEDFMSHVEHYRAVLDDLQQQRDLCQLKITEIDKAIASLRHLIPEEAKEEFPASLHVRLPLAPSVQAGKYTGMSVRWAILNLLNEDVSGAITTGDIADSLRRGGITSAGKNFPANVSAVLSNMNRVRGEVTSTEEGWVIATPGRNAWARIRLRLADQLHFTSSSVQ